MVKIKMDKYAYIYQFEMAPRFKVKDINKVIGLFGQQINQNGPSGLLNKVDSAKSDRFPRCSLLLLNLKVNLSKVKVILGHN